MNRKPKAKTPEDTDPQSPSKSSSSSETTPTGDTPPAAAEGSGDMQTQEVTMSFNGVSESPRKSESTRVNALNTDSGTPKCGHPEIRTPLVY